MEKNQEKIEEEIEVEVEVRGVPVEVMKEIGWILNKKIIKDIIYMTVNI